MELLGDVGQVESHFSPFGDSVSVSVRQVHGLHQMYRRLRNHFACTRWSSMVTWVMWNLSSFSLDIVLVSMQDRCSVSRQTYQRLRIVLDEPDGTPR